MPITTKHTTVYIASDGSEHPTLEAAQTAERYIQLTQHLHGDYSESEANYIAAAIVSSWDRIKTIMEAGGAMDPEDWGGANVAPRNEMERSLRLRCEECGNRFNHREGCSKRSV